MNEPRHCRDCNYLSISRAHIDPKSDVVYFCKYKRVNMGKLMPRDLPLWCPFFKDEIND